MSFTKIKTQNNFFFNFNFEFFNTHISHLAQHSTINMTLKWNHKNIYNKIIVFVEFWWLPNLLFGSFDCDYTLIPPKMPFGDVFKDNVTLYSHNIVSASAFYSSFFLFGKFDFHLHYSILPMYTSSFLIIGFSLMLIIFTIRWRFLAFDFILHCLIIISFNFHVFIFRCPCHWNLLCIHCNSF
jgi:hypothetical protein